MGTAGRIAAAFIQSKLTPLIVVAALAAGAAALLITPREEEPQIVVPMMDVFVSYPGATAEEVEQRVTKPMSRLLWEIKGVRYVYSTSMPGRSLVVVRFYVGEDMEDSLVKLYNKLMSNYDLTPPGVSQPLVKPKSIYDVPVLTLTLWSERYDGFSLRRVATELAAALKKDEDVAAVTVTGGRRRQIRIDLQPARLRAYGLDPAYVAGVLRRANVSLDAGSLPREDGELTVRTSGFIRSADELGNVVLRVQDGRPVYLRDVASITDGPEEPDSYVLMEVPARGSHREHRRGEAVTIAIAKKKDTNATTLAERLLEKTEALRGTLIPSDVEITVTRNYGDTAKEKSNELLEHMFIAAFSVTVLIALALGWRESIVVAVAVPVTLALTILVFYMFGYTLNRVTLFALIFSIGILVDDAIVIVENIHRHFVDAKEATVEVAVRAVDEVGNPTILATFTVIAALLPMGFVSGLMGPYMRPIPIGATAAMVLSLLIAFIISPWLANIVLRWRSGGRGVHGAGGGESRLMARFNALYERNLRSLIENRRKRMTFLGVVAALLLGSCGLLLVKAVIVKMLPYDNKSELEIVVDTDEGTTLEQTAAVVKEIGDYLATVPEVENYQYYIGTSAPFNFNGLVRHYYLREGSNVAEIQVNFVPKDERRRQSHDLARALRPRIEQIARRHGARVKVVEVPPGPPVLSTLVAEIYGPDYETQLAAARKVLEVFESTPGVVDADWSAVAPQKRIIYEVDRTKAAMHGLSPDAVSYTLRTLVGGSATGLVHVADDKEPVEIVLRSPLEERYRLENLAHVTLTTPGGKAVPLAELVRVKEEAIEQPIYSKNLHKVVYVTAEVAGREESPIYAILKMKPRIERLALEGGGRIEQLFTHEPRLEREVALKWDGEWQITYEVFRDLGVAFAAVMVLIYVMVVGWFKSFSVPLVIMAPIPISLIGILPAHALLGAFFTATSMIGFIAGAGIVVRNSIILIDFAELKLKEGMSLKEAVVEAGIVRFRPMLLTSSAVVVGAAVILFDPIFQGMAISLMAGEVAATLLSRTLVPLLYYMLKEHTLQDLPAGEAQPA